MSIATGDPVKFVYISSTDYEALSEKDPSTIYCILSNIEKRIAVGDILFANYVPAHCTAISLSMSSASIGLDEGFVLVATTEPASSSDPIIFTASNNNVTLTSTAYANRIRVDGAAIGTSVVTATCGDYSATCTVEVHREYVFEEHILAQNYNPNGAKFKYTAPITLTDGQYIEISIDLSTVTGTKENIISVGQNIDVWQGATAGAHMHNYVTASNKQKISVDIINNNKVMRPTYTNPSSQGNNYLIRIDQNGVWLNGQLFYFDTDPRVTPTMTYQEAMSAFLSLSSYDIGSQEGSNRSNATYNYIKYYTTS